MDGVEIRNLDQPAIREDGLQLEENRSLQRRFWQMQRIAWLGFGIVVLVALLDAMHWDLSPCSRFRCAATAPECSAFATAGGGPISPDTNPARDPAQGPGRALTGSSP